MRSEQAELEFHHSRQAWTPLAVMAATGRLVQVSPVRTPTEVGRSASSRDFHVRLFISGNFACSERTPKACWPTASWRNATNPICPSDKAKRLSFLRKGDFVRKLSSQGVHM